MKKTICFVLILAFAATALYGCGSADSTPTGESGSSDTTLPSILDTSKEDPLVITQIQTQSGTFNALYIYEVVSCTGDLVKPGEYYYVSSSPINNYTFVASSNLLQCETSYYVVVNGKEEPFSLVLSDKPTEIIPTYKDKGDTYLVTGYFSKWVDVGFYTKERLESLTTQTIEVIKSDSFVIFYDNNYLTDKTVTLGFYLSGATNIVSYWDYDSYSETGNAVLKTVFDNGAPQKPTLLESSNTDSINNRINTMGYESIVYNGFVYNDGFNAERIDYILSEIKKENGKLSIKYTIYLLP